MSTSCDRQGALRRVPVVDRCADDGNPQCSRLRRGFEATWRCAGRFPNPRRTVPLVRRARRSSLAAEMYPAGTPWSPRPVAANAA